MKRLLAASIFLPWLSLPALADEHAHHHAMQAAAPQVAEVPPQAVELRDLELLDQDGKTRRFRQDVIGDRLVAINFVYTTCTTVCPMQTAIFSTLQERLRDRLGRDVALVSISIDPVTDIPPRLKAYADSHQVRPGWTWLTGDKARVDQVLLGLGAYAADITQHPAMVLVGDGRSGSWSRFYGFPQPEQILARLDALQAARQTPHHHHH